MTVPGTIPCLDDASALGEVRAWRRARLAAVLVVLAGTLPSLPQGAVFWDNVVRIEVGLNLVEGRGPVILRGTPDDGQYVQRGRDGRSYASAPLGSILLQLPNALLASAAVVPFEGLPTLVLLAALAWVLVSWGRRAGASPLAAFAGAVATCLATALWPMAALGYDNLVEALSLAALLASAARPEGRRLWLGVGAIVAATFAVRQTAALLGVPALILALGRRPGGSARCLGRLGWMAAGAAPFLGAVVAYNLYRFGTVVSFDAAAARAGTLGEAAAFFVRPFSADHLTAIVALVASPGKGLVFYGPPLVLALVLARPLARRHPIEAAAFAAYAVSLLVFVGAFVNWNGDWSWGPRLVAALYVGAAPAVWWIADRLGSRGRAAAAALLLLVVAAQGVPVAGRPVATYFRERLGPLSLAGALATRTITRPPLRADTVTLYFTSRNSPIVVLAASLPRRLADDRRGPLLAAALVRTLVAPLAALLALLLLKRGATPVAARAGEGEATG